MDVSRFNCRLAIALAVCGAALAVRAEAPADDFAQAAEHYRQSRWQEAHDAFGDFARQHASDPRREPARFYAAECLIELRQYAEAAREFAELSTSLQDSKLAKKARFRAGETSYLIHDLPAAREQLEAFHQQHPDDPLNAYALAYLGEIELSSEHLEPAQRWLRLSLKQYPDGPLAEDVRFDLARAAKLERRFDDAIKQFTALAAKPDHPRAAEALAHVGSCRLAQNNYPAAEKAFREALERKPAQDVRVEATLGLAQCLIQTERSGAIALLESLADDGDHRLDVQYAWGLAYRAEKKWSQAAEKFIAVAGEDDDGSRATLAAECLLHAEQPKRAKQQVDHVLEQWPDSSYVPVALALGIEAARELDDQPSLDRYTKLLESQFPEHEVTRKLREARAADEHTRTDSAERMKIAATMESGRWSEASEQLTNFLAQHADDASADWARGELALCRVHRAEEALQAGKTAEAKPLLEQLLAEKPTGDLLAHVLYLQSQVAVGERDWAAVAAPLERLIQASPHSPLVPLARYWQAESLYQQQEYDRAGEFFDQLAAKASAPRPDWMANVELRRAQIATVQKRWDDAIQRATSLAKDDPNFALLHEADEVLGRAHAAQADFDAAREALRRVVDSSSSAQTEAAARCQWLIGETYFLQEDYRTAIREYLRVDVQYAYPAWQAAALFEAARCHEQLGESAQATELYARLLKQYPDAPLADEASRRLRTAQNIDSN